MAGRIRGITIEIGGDTEGLVKSLKNASKASSDVQKELKDINKVLKFDSSNTELLSQKQKALKENVEAVKNQLEEEEKALQELQKAGDSESNVKAQEALQRQIVETKAKLKDAEAELKNFGSVGSQQIAELGKKFQEVGGKIEAVGKGMTKYVTGPILALGGGSVAAFNEVDAGLDKIIQKTGATGDELEGMETIFKNIATTVPADMEEIGDAIGEVNTRFGSTGDELEGLSEQFIKFAKLNGQDVTSAIDQTQKALSAYGLGAESAAGYLDAMNKVAQMTGVSTDKLQSGLIANATAFQELGLGIDEATLLMGQLEKSGANSETVLNGMRKALKNATAEGKPFDQALAELQDTIENGSGSMDGLTAAYELFGKSGDQIYGAVKNGTLNFKELVGVLGDTEGSVTDTFEAMQDPTDKFALALQQIKLLGAEIGAVLLDTLAPVIEKVSTTITSFLEKWQTLSPEMQKTILIVAGVAAAIGPLLMGLGNLITMIGSIMTMWPVLSAGFGAIAAPVAGVVAAIAALVAIGIVLYKNWDTIKAKAVEIWDAIKAFFTKTLTAIKTTFSNIWNGIKTTITNVITGIWNTIVTVWTTIYNWLYEKISAIFNFYKTIFTGIRDTIASIWNGIKEKVVNVWSSITTYIRDKVNAIKTNVVGKFQSIRSSLSSTFSSVWETITSPFRKAKDTLEGIISRIKGFFPINLGNIFSSIRLPHFSVSGGEFPYGIGGRGSMPKFYIDWYRKAMDNGMILDGPTIFGMDTRGHFLAGGEAGSETVVGTNSLMSMIQNAVNNSGGVNASLIYEAVRQGASDATIKAYLSGRDVTDEVGRELTKIQSYNSRFQGA